MASSPSRASNIDSIKWFSSRLDSWRAAVATVSREIDIEIKIGGGIVEASDGEGVGEESVHFVSREGAALGTRGEAGHVFVYIWSKVEVGSIAVTVTGTIAASITVAVVGTGTSAAASSSSVASTIAVSIAIVAVAISGSWLTITGVVTISVAASVSRLTWLAVAGLTRLSWLTRGSGLS